MTFDSTPFAGFELSFDFETGVPHWGDGLDFNRLPRTSADMRQVLLEPDALPPETPLYTTWNLCDAPAPVRSALDAHDLTYTMVMLPPLRVGCEFVKTAGHYHTSMPGTTLGYPEVYTQLAGHLLLLLQARAGENDETLTDMVLVDMRPGFSITIPPHYAHIMINVSNQTALMAGLYSKNFKQEYDYVRAQRGAAWYVLGRDNEVDAGGPENTSGDGGSYHVRRNPLYPAPPDLRFLTRTAGSRFAPPHPDAPLWSSYLHAPEAYTFLFDSHAALEHFQHEWRETPIKAR